MKILVYSVKDVVSGQYNRLEMFVNEECAKRWFNELLVESKIAKDLQLWKIGTFDTVLGVFESDLDFVQGGEIIE